MAPFIFLILFTSIILDTQAFEANCPIVKCGHGAPDIRFPFRVKTQQPKHCGHPGFELVCKENNTVLQFPSYRDLVVNSISYDTKKLNLLDPKICVHEVFLNLNLSLTPFEYYYVVKNYTYLNCSARLSPSFTQIPCLSGFGHHVYTVESSFAVPGSCRPVKTIAIPFSYSPYLSDNSFGLGLTWDLPGGEDSEAKGGQSKTGHQTRCLDIAHDKGSARGFGRGLIRKRRDRLLGYYRCDTTSPVFDYKSFSTKHLIIVLGIGIFILTAATLISMKMYQSKKLDGQKEKENQLEVEKLLGDYKNLKDGRYSNAAIKGGELSV